MSETTTIKGTWWLPENPDRKLIGEISYSPVDGAELDLFEHFFDQLSTDRFTVWGITVKGKPVSLFDCHTMNITMHMPGARLGKVSSNFGVVGGHYAFAEEMQFVEVTADLSHLFEWARTTGINVEPFKSDNKLHITQARLPDVYLGRHGDLSVRLEFSSKFSPGYGRCELTEYCHLRVSSGELASYEKLEEVIHRIQHFIALGVARPVYALSVKAFTQSAEEIEQQPVEIIRAISVTPTGKRLMPHELQFGLNDLQPDPSFYVQNFLDKHDQLKPVCDLYFSTIYHSDMFLRQRFLALAHAVEAYHRIFFGGQYQSTDEYANGLQKKLIAAIPDEIDRDFKASLKTKLQYLHEFSLRKRIRDICEQFADMLEPSLGNPIKFACSTSELRNRLTHADSEAGEQANPAEWKELWLKSEQLSLLLEVCLLHQLDFSEQKIRELLPRNRRPERIFLNKNR